MRTVLRLLAAGFLTLALGLGAQAADLELYVNNRPFQGRTATVSGKLYAPVDSFLRAAGYSWSVSGDRVEILPGAEGGPGLSGPAGLWREGSPLEVPTAVREGRLYAEVGALARALGLLYNANAELGIVDVNRPVGRGAIRGGDRGRKEEPPAQGPAEVPAGTDTQKGEEAGKEKPGKIRTGKLIRTDGTNKYSPIEIVRLDFSDSTIPGAAFVGEVRVSTTIKNTSEKEDLEQVTLFLQLVDGYGEPIREWKQPIGTLKAGQTYTFAPDSVWYNYSQIKVWPRVIVEHEELPREVDEGEK